MMKTHIKAHPIDKDYFKFLGIYNTTCVNEPRVGTVVRRLVERGYTDTRIEVSENKITIYCDKPRGKNA